MCGILAVFKYNQSGDLRQTALKLSARLRHRGPDWNGMKIVGNNALAHERQAIVDLDNGAQPLTDINNKYILSVNGEIYNHKQHRKDFANEYTFLTGSDCEVIIPLYIKYGADAPKYLDGMFSFVLYDIENDTHIVARDPIGITPLYRGWGEDGSLWYASELKALKDNCSKIETFPPGHVFSSKTGLQRYYNPDWFTAPVPTKPCDLTRLRETFENAVIKRLMCDVPFGVLLSGGLDSSLVASIASRYLEKKNKTPSDDDSHLNWWPRLHSFAIGLKGAPDLEAARHVAKFLNTVHHEFNFTIQDGHDALRDVIYHLETFDVTTIRASTPMYLLSRRIKATGVKMVLSGEGSDEIFGGYLYFHRAPSAADLHDETIKRVQNLHLADCLRANKSTMAWGVEARVPFLDKEFLEASMTFNPEEKMHQPGRIEKYVLRKAFDTPESPYLPDNVLWRQKEQFSDGVGYSWIDSLKDAAEKNVTEAQLASAKEHFPHDTPLTKEAYWYREMFDELFPQETVAKTVMRWIPKAEWGCNADPSGRAQTVHQQTYTPSK